MLAGAILFMNSGLLGMQAMPHAMGYEDRLFDNTKVHTIAIVMNDWDEFIANAASEEYYAANIAIDGETYKNVGIRAKGNTSLSAVAALDSERYSFKIEFDQYDSTKSYYGLDKLSLNNLIQDSTMMKDYMTYTMMHEFDVNASLCSFVYITVNDKDWGLYLAVEGVEEAFLERNYGSDYGELYKPDSMDFGGGDDKKPDELFDQENREMELPPAPPNQENREIGMQFEPSAMLKGGEETSDAFERGALVVKLQYIDDQLDSYSNIWDNAKTDITKADQNRLVESLKKLSSREDIASVVDIEQVIRYFVVHNFVCNGDSYTGSMIHNYYLYEQKGQMAMIPWDYNLAFGTFQGGNAQSTVNTPIDSPVENGSGEDRPMWNWIVSDETYTSLYHEYFETFLSSVNMESMIDHAYNQIKSYVAKDPTAFYTYEEFETGVETLRQFCKMRSQSISMQLENGETVNCMNYVDASAITLSDMGSMDTGMGGFGGGLTSKMERNSSFVHNRTDSSSNNTSGWIWIAVSVFILAVGLLTAKKYKS